MSGVISAVMYWRGREAGGFAPAAMSRDMTFSVLQTGARGIQAAVNKAEPE